MELQPQLQQQQQLWVFELCALGGVPISIHYTMLLLVIIQVFAATLSYQDRTYNTLMFLLYCPILLITAFIVSAPTPRLVADSHGLMLATQFCSMNLGTPLRRETWAALSIG